MRRCRHKRRRRGNAARELRSGIDHGMVGRKALVRALLVAQRMRVALAERRFRKLILWRKEPIESRRQRGVGRRVELVHEAADDGNASRSRSHNVVCGDGLRRCFRRRRRAGADLLRNVRNGRVLRIRRELQELIAYRHRFVADRELRH
ncbi:hypothetical protein [Bradyrhizobium sp. OK095]|uniref:hypothetical protein n=1 Tax=Bradyrhizobium sp. OK095 TaxID=1882760 RepID=UPI00115FD982|nr:hypothetical protein [Bradyrhizobium sp. OK095]